MLWGYKMLKKVIVFILFSLSFLLAEYKINPENGLIIDENVELIENNCLACHNSSLIVNMNVNREAWIATIRWMQESEGLWEIPVDNENKILDYLTKHYGEKYNTRRRLPLPVLLER